jgi:undecaprenyl-diphosphatase
MPAAEPALKLRHAAALGLLQGPAELLPVSSSAHIALVPWLAGWPYARLDAELRKSFEVALHAGAGAALTIRLSRRLPLILDARHAWAAALSLAPPALAGLTLQRYIERRLGGPRSIAAGLAGGALAMAWADARPGDGRGFRDVRPGDGLALGLAQAAALAPGVSRNGAALATARARGFSRPAAAALSWHAALPVMLGAGVLRAAGLVRRPPPPGAGRAMLAGAAGAFASTLAAARLAPPLAPRPLAPFALYRLALAALVTRRLRRSQ